MCQGCIDLIAAIMRVQPRRRYQMVEVQPDIFERRAVLPMSPEQWMENQLPLTYQLLGWQEAMRNEQAKPQQISPRGRKAINHGLAGKDRGTS